MTQNFTPLNNIGELDYKIYFLRGRRVMLDRDLALLYGVETKNLNKAVKRNILRFPDDFMFQLAKEEDLYISSRSQNATSKESLEVLRFQNGRSKDENGLDKPNLKFQNGTSSLRSQIVTSKDTRGGRRYKTYAFSEQGVAMLSSVLKSERAIQVNIQIMRTFTKIREMLASNTELRDKIEELESKYDSQFAIVFKAIKQLLADPDNSNKKSIGFKTD